MEHAQREEEEENRQKTVAQQTTFGIHRHSTHIPAVPPALDSQVHLKTINATTLGSIHSLSKMKKSTLNASRNVFDSTSGTTNKHMLQWNSGRRKWHSLLELANIDVQPLQDSKVLHKRYGYHHSSLLPALWPLLLSNFYGIIQNMTD